MTALRITVNVCVCLSVTEVLVGVDYTCTLCVCVWDLSVYDVYMCMGNIIQVDGRRAATR